LHSSNKRIQGAALKGKENSDEKIERKSKLFFNHKVVKGRPSSLDLLIKVTFSVKEEIIFLI
jgi:hypothetical protein